MRSVHGSSAFARRGPPASSSPRSTRKRIRKLTKVARRHRIARPVVSRRGGLRKVEGSEEQIDPRKMTHEVLVARFIFLAVVPAVVVRSRVEQGQRPQPKTEIRVQE